MMNVNDVFSSVATQLFAGSLVEVGGSKIRVRRTSASRLRIAAFEVDGKRYEAIEQNPEKPSRWGELARSGHQVVQFKDTATNRFVAVSVDGKVKVYGSKSKQ